MDLRSQFTRPPRRLIRQTLIPFLSAIFLLVVLSGTTLAATPAFQASWVQNFRPTHLWSGPDPKASDYGIAPQWSFLQVVAPQQGTRLFVRVPWTGNYAYVDAKDVGPSGPPPPPTPTPSATPIPKATPAPTVVATPSPVPVSSANWLGTVIGGGMRERPSPSVSAPTLRIVPDGTAVQVVAWVAGDEITPGDWTWARLADGNYGYSEALGITPPSVAPPPPADHPSGKWVDVNLLHQTAVAYVDNTPVYLAIASTGSPGWETPTGIHSIWSRVPSETMRSSTLSGLDPQQAAQAHYDLSGVLYTQYFDGSGDALHDNYWLPNSEFGAPHSHGCVGLRVNDALWFWNWADYGTPVYVHLN